MQFFVILLLLIIVSYAIYFLLKALVMKEMSNPKHLDTLLSTLDDTVYGHITLIENETKQLESVIERAKRLLVLLEKEEKIIIHSKELNIPILKNKSPFNAVMNIEKDLYDQSMVKVELSEDIYKKPKHSAIKKEDSDDNKFDTNKEVISLYREGKEIDEIAALLAIPQARIQLITSIYLSNKKPQSLL